MSDLPDELPSDPAELRVFAAALLDRCARLERLLKLAKDAQFGRSSEKLDADQLQLVLEDIDEAVAALEAAEDRADPKKCERRTAERRANRGKLPEHLPRIVETLMPAETCCPCCKGDLFEIGRDESQRLDVVPVQYRVIITRRPKLACRACHGVVLQHAAPERLIEGGLPTERLVAHVIDAKYHLAFAALPPGADAGDARYRHRPFHARLLGRLCRPGIEALVASSAPASARLFEALCR